MDGWGFYSLGTVVVGCLVRTGCGSASPTCCSSDGGIRGDCVLSSGAGMADVGQGASVRVRVMTRCIAEVTGSEVGQDV